MIYVLNKNKIISYMVASFIVIALFTFSSTAIPNRDIQIVKVSSNVTENINVNSAQTIIKKNNNNM